MQRKLAGYVLLSFLSFGIFTTLFHAVANAQTSELIAAPTVTPATPKIPPTPTIAGPKLVQAQPQTKEQDQVQFSLKPADETHVAQVVEQPTPTPTEKPEPTKAPVVTPTAVPTAVPTVEPTATPAPKPAVVAPGDLDPLFEKYASEYGIDKEDLKSIAKCEAGFNPNSQSPNGLYAGMYQFGEQTWIGTRNSMGLDPNPELRKNAEESIKTAAFKIKNGGRGAWPNC